VQDGSKFCFRKHQVWVRNGDTSDLATPEQVVALSLRRLRPEPEPEYTNTAYSKPPREQQIPALRRDIRVLCSGLGYKVTPVPLFTRAGHNSLTEEFRVSIPIRGKLFVFRCSAQRSLTKQYMQPIAVSTCWNLEHGIIPFLSGGLTRSAKLLGPMVDCDLRRVPTSSRMINPPFRGGLG
jgi:hypothetical protein